MKISSLILAVMLSSIALSSSELNPEAPLSHRFIQDNPLSLLKTKGCKVYITGNDANAQIHLKRELEFYDVWSIQSNRSDADFEIKLLTKKSGIANADRDVRIVITSLKNGEEVFVSNVVNGTEYGFKTVNLKEAAIKNLVENELKPKIFK